MRCLPSSSHWSFAAILAVSALCEAVVSAEPEREPSDRFTVVQAGEMVLARIEGNTPIDNELRKWQQRAASAPAAEAPWTKLGELFIEKARLSADPAFYKFAE